MSSAANGRVQRHLLREAAEKRVSHHLEQARNAKYALKNVTDWLPIEIVAYICEFLKNDITTMMQLASTNKIYITLILNSYVNLWNKSSLEISPHLYYATRVKGGLAASTSSAAGQAESYGDFANGSEASSLDQLKRKLFTLPTSLNESKLATLSKRFDRLWNMGLNLKNIVIKDMKVLDYSHHKVSLAIEPARALVEKLFKLEDDYENYLKRLNLSDSRFHFKAFVTSSSLEVKEITETVSKKETSKTIYEALLAYQCKITVMKCAKQVEFENCTIPLLGIRHSIMLSPDIHTLLFKNCQIIDGIETIMLSNERFQRELGIHFSRPKQIQIPHLVIDNVKHAKFDSTTAQKLILMILNVYCPTTSFTLRFETPTRLDWNFLALLNSISDSITLENVIADLSNQPLVDSVAWKAKKVEFVNCTGVDKLLEAANNVEHVSIHPCNENDFKRNTRVNTVEVTPMATQVTIPPVNELQAARVVSIVNAKNLLEKLTSAYPFATSVKIMGATVVRKYKPKQNIKLTEGDYFELFDVKPKLSIQFQPNVSKETYPSNPQQGGKKVVQVFFEHIRKYCFEYSVNFNATAISDSDYLDNLYNELHCSKPEFIDKLEKAKQLVVYFMKGSIKNESILHLFRLVKNNQFHKDAIESIKKLVDELEPYLAYDQKMQHNAISTICAMMEFSERIKEQYIEKMGKTKTVKLVRELDSLRVEYETKKALCINGLLDISHMNSLFVEYEKIVREIQEEINDVGDYIAVTPSSALSYFDTETIFAI